MQSRAGNCPHKCSIHWEVPGRGVASTSFPVSSCLLKCKPTFTDNHYNKKFPAAFSLKQKGKNCKCTQSDGTSVLTIHGDCDAPDASNKCFEFYKRLRTNEYTREFGKDTTRIIPHFELFDEPKFDYTTCEENACPNGDCYESVFPSIMEGRSEEEMALLADILKKHKEKGTVDEGAQELIDHLTEEEKIALLGDSEIEEAFEDVQTTADGQLTVAVLRDIYNDKLKGTGISVTHLLHTAGLTEDEHVVDYDEFKRFLKPECPEE